MFEILKFHVLTKPYLETGTTLNALITSIDTTIEYFNCENLYDSSFSVFRAMTSEKWILDILHDFLGKVHPGKKISS